MRSVYCVEYQNLNLANTILVPEIAKRGHQRLKATTIDTTITIQLQNYVMAPPTFNIIKQALYKRDGMIQQLDTAAFCASWNPYMCSFEYKVGHYSECIVWGNSIRANSKPTQLLMILLTLLLLCSSLYSPTPLEQPCPTFFARALFHNNSADLQPPLLFPGQHL